MRRTGAEIVIEALVSRGVDTVFGFPGAMVLRIYDELYRNHGRIRHILTSHEQGAAHAADGYARATGRVGVCLATSGPGATNLVTGIATAFLDSVPVVFLTGNVATWQIGTDSFQEMDITGITMPITKHNWMVKDVELLGPVLEEAFALAVDGRPGPVLVDIPKDVLEAIAEYEPSVPPPPLPLAERMAAYEARHGAQLDEAARILHAAERPFLLAGGGARGGWGEGDASRCAPVIALAERLQAPAATSMMGQGVFPADHPLYLGNIGIHGSAQANRAAAECDVCLAIGTRFNDRVGGGLGQLAEDSRLVHIDIDRAEINKNLLSRHHLIGDAAVIMPLLNARLEALQGAAAREAISQDAPSQGTPSRYAQGMQYAQDIRDAQGAQGEQGVGAQGASAERGETPAACAQGGLAHAEASPPRLPWRTRQPEPATEPALRPRYVLGELQRLLPRDAFIATDVGQHQLWVARHCRFDRPGLLLTSGGLGTMGFGLGAAIGAAIAHPGVDGQPGRRVVLVTGDGSFRMNQNELATVAAYDLPILILVMNNGALGLVREWQKTACGGRYEATTLDRPPDFVKLADAFGIRGYRPRTAEEVGAAIEAALSGTGAALVDCPIDIDARTLEG